jgi:molybdate transport system substrate-binding protein
MIASVKSQIPVPALRIPAWCLLAACCFWFFPFLAASAADDKPGAVVTVAAAANLQSVLPRLQEAFKRPDIQLRFVTGSTGKLCTQILSGAPFDLLLAADTEGAGQLDKAGRAVTPPAVYARGVLVCAYRRELAKEGAPLGVDWTRVKRLVIADPALAPYGRAAEQVIAAARLPLGKETDILRGQNISQAAQFLVTGAAEAGFIARSQVDSLDSKIWAWAETPSSLSNPILQAAVLVAPAGGGKPSSGAREFYQFLFSSAAKDVFVAAGYRLP